MAKKANVRPRREGSLESLRRWMKKKKMSSGKTGKE